MEGKMREKGRVKSIFSLLLVIVMVLGMMPAVAFAASSSSTGQVHVIVENTLYTVANDSAPWDGSLVNTWINVDNTTTAMDAVVVALNKYGYSYTITNSYGSDIFSEINGLVNGSAGGWDGWMGTLNDWFTASSLANYTVTDGDEVRMMYSMNGGQDVGSDWSNNNTNLAALSVYGGALSPAFSSDVLTYTFDVSTTSDPVKIVPTAANKNFLVRIYNGSNMHKRGESMYAVDGDTISIIVNEQGTNPAPNMNSHTGSTTYTLNVVGFKPEKKSSGGSGGGGAAATTTTETTQTTATTATTEVETKATVADGKATANVTADDVNKAIENVNKQAATEKASEKEVVLEVKSEGNVDSVEATIPASATKELAKADASVVVKTDCGNVEIPADTMDSIASQASGQDLSVVVENKKAEDVITSDVSEKIKEETGLEKAALDGASIVDVTIKAGNTEITSFGGGKVKLSLPVVGKQIVGKLYKVLAISANGALDMLTGKCSMKNGAKVMDVDSTHLTTFVLTTEEVKNPFSDVKEGDYFYNPVIWAVDKNVTSGKTEDTFAPYEGCTRAQMVTFLWRAAGSPWASANRHFSDVADNAYYKDAVEWAIAAGITNGISDTKFNPNGSVTREQLAAFIYRYAQSMGKGFTGSWMFLLDYDDASQVSQWADEAMHWCVMNNIVTGTTAKTLSPAGEANRAQIVTMLYRYFNL